jgi:hypothetical protein
METMDVVKALEGDQSLLLVLPKEVAAKMGIANQDWLRYEVKNGELVITKTKEGEPV